MAKKIAFLKSLLKECKFSFSVQSPVSSMCHRMRVSFLQPSMLYKIMKPPVFARVVFLLHVYSMPKYT